MNERKDTVLPGSGAMFDAIAHRYDFMNRVLSLGIDQGWRRRAVQALGLTGPARVLDVATGTADLALAIAEMLPEASVVGLDPSERMLEIAKQKIQERDLGARIELRRGDAETLVGDDAAFDGVTIAFGIRNVPDRARALREMRRVTRSGGRVVVLELGEPEKGPFRALAGFHIHRVVPWLGGLLSSSREYRYLQTSIAAFPPARVFVDMMQEAGFDPVTSEALTFGVANLYVGTVP